MNVKIPSGENIDNSSDQFVVEVCLQVLAFDAMYDLSGGWVLEACLTWTQTNRGTCRCLANGPENASRELTVLHMQLMDPMGSSSPGNFVS